MNGIVLTLIIIAMLAVVGVMVTGLVFMAKSDNMEGKKFQNKLMAARIWIQAIAIALVFLAFAISKK